ncbi:unnamed protein product [Owenia fusiformis]|uniref:Ion transport domain-containing protein n=1 Tax=Owenia fusiformis TaxID=6347 RepID=A0A8S4NX20_OWEFU|nr:unnamed protein product [Owenia fusiformis]
MASDPDKRPVSPASNRFKGKVNQMMIAKVATMGATKVTAEEKLKRDSEENKAQTEAQKHIKDRFKSLKGVWSLAAKRKTAGPGVEVEPDVRRRFLFDDAALKQGASLNDLFVSEEPPEIDFKDIVDQDDTFVEVFVSQELVGNMVDSIYFRSVITGLIVINSILIGLQTDEQMSVDYAYVFSIFDNFVLTIFVCELIIKWFHGFWIFWKTGWNILDFVIILALFLGPTLTFLGSSRILRILRVLRAFKSLRSVSALAGLSLVVQTILQSIPDMVNIILLLTIILLVFAVAGVTLFNKEVPDRFGDLESAMFSLFICVTQDGWVGIFDRFKGKSEGLHIGGAIYFFCAIMVGAFVFANLVVAVVVTNLELAMKELKQENKALEDNLAPAGVSTGDSSHTDADAVNIVKLKDTQVKVDLTAQTPIQLSELKYASTEKLENFYLILTALEENLAEYHQIRQDLEKVFDVVCSMNTPDSDDEDEIDTFDTTNIDIEKIKTKGDIISNLIALEKQQQLTSDNAGTMSDVIKSAVRDERKQLERQFKKKRGSTVSLTKHDDKS